MNGRTFIYDQTSGIHLMPIHCAAAERGVYKQKRKDSSSAKLKIFTHTYRVSYLVRSDSCSMAEITTLSFTGTSDSISGVSRITGTCEGSWSVSAAGIIAATSVVCCTFVDIYITTNQIQQLFL